MIEHIKHYAFENPGSVYDEEALTALQLCARLGVKMNELVDFINGKYDTTTKKYEAMVDTMTKEIPANVQKAVKEWLATHPNAVTYVSPELFGAVGDGVTDDTDAIQAAIISLAGQVGNVYLGACQYCITRPITITSNVNLVGVGSAKYGRYNSDIPSTVIVYKGGGDESMVNYDRSFLGETVFGGSIRNLTLDGQNRVDHVVDLRKAGRVTIDGCAIVASQTDGIYLARTYENIISNNWFGNFYNSAVNMEDYANANVVENNAIELSHGSKGIYLHNCNGNIIRGNTIEGGVNTSIGVMVTGGVYTTKNIITGNRIEFESHRYDGEKEGACIQIGQEGTDSQPVRNIVKDNAVFNQVLYAKGDTTQYNLLKEFVDYGVGTITDFYDYTNINPNPHMIVVDNRIEGFEPLDQGFTATQNERYSTIHLTNADYEYPVYYRLIDGKQYRGENIAVSCKLNAKEKPISVDLEFYRGGTTQGWEGKGNLIERHTAKTLDVGYDELLHLQAVVPYECDTIAVYFNFRDQQDSRANIYWLKIGNNVTWR